MWEKGLAAYGDIQACKKQAELELGRTFLIFLEKEMSCIYNIYKTTFLMNINFAYY